MRILVLARVTGVVLAGISFGQSQPVSLIRMSDTVWSYYQEGNEPTNAAQPGVSWKVSEFDDAAWPQGLPLFGFETIPLPEPIRTPLFLTAPGATVQTLTYYFRTHFNWSGGSNAVLLCTNLLDDGAIIYVNGFETYRYRMFGTPAYNTFANGQALQEGVYEITNVFTSHLLPGDNVIAVEVHQVAPTSGDIVFGLAVAALVPEEVTITEQPTALTDAVVGDDVAFTVEATGTDLKYLWFFNNVPVVGGTGPTLRRDNVAMNQAGTYYAIVSNYVNSVRSSNAVLRLIPDTFGPRVLSAVVLAGESNRFLIQFNEDVLRTNRGDPSASGTNLLNYVVTEVGTTNRLEVLTAQVGIGAALVRLTVAPPFDRTKEYEVCIFNISDVRTNFIAQNSCVPIAIQNLFPAISYRTFWLWYDDANPPPAIWNRPDFIPDQAVWRGTMAMFYSMGGVFNPPCTAEATAMSAIPTTYYFRRTFNVQPNLLGLPATAEIGTFMVDGAVFYLNGTEILRTNMPNALITHDTRALAPGNTNLCFTNQVAIGTLLAQENVLAVEVHRYNPAAAAAAFDASLNLIFSFAPVAPQATVALERADLPPNELLLYWTNGFGYALESASDLTGPWQEVQPASTNVVVTKDGNRRFYRLNKRH